MRLIEVITQFEKCAPDKGGACKVDHCPLGKNIKFLLTTPNGETAYMQMEGCSIVARLKRQLAGKKPGESIKDE